MALSPLVSIVMPSLNQEKFIGASMDSVLGQNNRQLELIVADGGSTDGTIELLTQKANSDPRLRWVSKPDSGPAEALNKALASTRGTIIGWLNSDDLYLPGTVERAIEAFTSHEDWIMLYGHAQHVDEQGAIIDQYPTQLPTGSINRFADGCFICQPSVFFKKTMHMLLGDLDQTLKASFDFDYWLRAFSAFPDRIGFIDAVQAQSRLHEACITARMRRTVAIEGVRVVASHLGKAPVHWITTYIEELLAQSPEMRNVEHLRPHLLELIKEVETWVDRSDLDGLRQKIETDDRLSLS